MAVGKKRIPRHLKVLAGTIQPCRDNPNQPQLPNNSPECPAFLAKSARKHWKRLLADLERLRVITPAHGDVCAIYAETMALYIQLRDEIASDVARDGGICFTSETGVKRQHPLMGPLNDAKRLLLSMLSEFGLTPASNSKVSVLPGMPPPSPHESKIQSGKSAEEIEARYFSTSIQ